MRRLSFACLAVVLALVPGWAHAGPRKNKPAPDAPTGEKLLSASPWRVRATTRFAADGIEQFVAAAGDKNGGIVAFGNAWGPGFPAEPKPAVLGKGTWHKMPCTCSRAVSRSTSVDHSLIASGPDTIFS